jgi:hypothetical protein
MKIWKYKLTKNPNDYEGDGFTIQEENHGKKPNKKTYSIWHDPFEGGQAYDSDWTIVNEETFPNLNLPDLGEWKSFDEAYKWIVDNFGEITEIEID